MSFKKIIVNGHTAEVFQRWQDAPHPGVFTSFRALARGGKMHVLGLSFHYERLLAGCQRFGLSIPDLEDITAGILEGMEDLHLKEARVRVELFRDLHITRIGTIDRLDFNVPLVSLKTVSMVRPYEDLKTACGAALSERCQSECQSSGEALYLDPYGTIIEGAWSNFCWIGSSGSVCFTGRGLNGVTQRIIRALLSETDREVQVMSATPQDLANSRVAPFITSALRGVVAVSKINDIIFPPSEDIAEIRRLYSDATYLLSDS
jgi:branched-subunit amino acid aminotransferase/4-amino-4-deoxychorismate lyase